MRFFNLSTALPPSLIILVAAFSLSITGYRDYITLKELADSNNPIQSYTKKTSVEEIPLNSSSSNWTHLFGKFTEKSAVTPAESLPETRLNLTLMGTFTHATSNKASALIAESGKQSERYFVGEYVPGDAELVKVNAGSVVLRRNGQDEQLSLPILQGDSKQDTASRKPGRSAHYSANNNDSGNINISRSETPISPEAKGQNNSLKDRLAQLRAKRNKSE